MLFYVFQWFLNGFNDFLMDLMVFDVFCCLMDALGLMILNGALMSLDDFNGFLMIFTEFEWVLYGFSWFLMFQNALWGFISVQTDFLKRCRQIINNLYKHIYNIF